MSEISLITSGLKATKKGMDVSMQNINNSLDPNYTRRIVNFQSDLTAGVVNGVKVSSVVRYYEQYLTEAVQKQNAYYSKCNTVTKYLDSIQSLFGDIGSTQNINTAIDNFLYSCQTLAANVTNQALKEDAVNQASILGDTISNLATGILNLQYDIDREIYNQVNQANSILNELQITNSNIINAPNIETQDNFKEVDTLTTQLSNYIDINPFYTEDGALYLSTNEGYNLLSLQLSRLEYTPVAGIDIFLNQGYINPLNLITTGVNGNDFMPVPLVKGGQSPSERTTLMENGSISALVLLRDKYIPETLGVLNNLAKELSFNINKLHNQGSGFPPVTSYQSTNIVAANNFTSWQGKVMMSITDVNGNPVYNGDGAPLKPLLLDLENLDSGVGAGMPTVKTIIDEVNQYFQLEPTNPRTSIGLLSGTSDQYLIRDVQLVAHSNIENNRFSFKMQFDNDSSYDSIIDVVNIKVYDINGVEVPNALVTNLPNAQSILKGSREKLSSISTVDFGASTVGPYTIDVEFKALGENGDVFSSSLSFVVENNLAKPNVINKHYYPVNISGDAYKFLSGTNQAFMKASLVDPSGHEIDLEDTTYKQGYINFTTLNSNYKIIISDYTSTEQGLNATGALAGVAPTNKGFGHFYGINDLYQQTFNDTNYAYYMTIREDIKKDSSKLSVSNVLKSSPVYKENKTGQTKSSLIVKFDVQGPQVGDGDSITIGTTTFTFKNTPTNLESDIQIGSNWFVTLDNMVNTLSKKNNTTKSYALNCDYQVINPDSLYMQFRVPGSSGDSLPVTVNLTASGNNALFTFAPGDYATSGTSTLKNGTDQILSTLGQNSYRLPAAANNTINDISNLISTIITFASVTGMPGTTRTLTEYASMFVSTQTSDFNLSKLERDNAKEIYDAYKKKYDSQALVDSDQELVKVMDLNNTFISLSKVMDIIFNSMWREFFNSIG